jgi:hypothetical protein
MPLEKYPDDAIERAREDALEWLTGNSDGYPRSWEQEAANDARRGEIFYDEFQAPPIAGYEALEREGLARRVGEVVKSDETRVHFVLISSE